MKRDIYDVAVIGGGPGGYTAALYCARSGLSVLVLEKMDRWQPPVLWITTPDLKKESTDSSLGKKCSVRPSGSALRHLL